MLSLEMVVSGWHAWYPLPMLYLGTAGPVRAAWVQQPHPVVLLRSVSYPSFLLGPIHTVLKSLPLVLHLLVWWSYSLADSFVLLLVAVSHPGEPLHVAELLLVLLCRCLVGRKNVIISFPPLPLLTRSRVHAYRQQNRPCVSCCCLLGTLWMYCISVLLAKTIGFERRNSWVLLPLGLVIEEASSLLLLSYVLTSTSQPWTL